MFLFILFCTILFYQFYWFYKRNGSYLVFGLEPKKISTDRVKNTDCTQCKIKLPLNQKQPYSCDVCKGQLCRACSEVNVDLEERVLELKERKVLLFVCVKCRTVTLQNYSTLVDENRILREKCDKKERTISEGCSEDFVKTEQRLRKEINCLKQLLKEKTEVHEKYKLMTERNLQESVERVKIENQRHLQEISHLNQLLKEKNEMHEFYERNIIKTDRNLVESVRSVQIENQRVLQEISCLRQLFKENSKICGIYEENSKISANETSKVLVKSVEAGNSRLLQEMSHLKQLLKEIINKFYDENKKMSAEENPKELITIKTENQRLLQEISYLKHLLKEKGEIYEALKQNHILIMDKYYKLWNQMVKSVENGFTRNKKCGINITPASSTVRDQSEIGIGSSSAAQDKNSLAIEVLTVIAKEKLFSPQLVIDAVGTGNAEITLGHIRSYIMNELQQEIKKSTEAAELTKNYRKDTDKLKQHLENLKSGVTVIQGSRCAACHHQLELPTIHFLCNHSFHQHCFQSYSDDENECPTCQPENKNLLELLKAREYNKDLHETFHSQLEKAHDGFAVAAEYFGRGVFNSYKILRDEILEKTLALPEKSEVKTKAKSSPKFERELKNYGLGAEARIRQAEAKSQIRSDLSSEGRIRVQENRYSSSVTSTSSSKSSSFTSKSYEPKSHMPSKGYKVKKQTSVSYNPFEEDDDDDEKNPFRDEEDDELDKTNPFREDFDCDKNFNPFN